MIYENKGFPPNKPHIILHYILKRTRSKVRGNINNVDGFVQGINFICMLMEDKLVLTVHVSF